MRTAGMTGKAVAPTTLPIRLRYLLLVALAILTLWQLVPRVVATWRLHALATTFADYAVCMAGPTGSTELRDNPSEFWRIVRRRLITSPADSHPFSACAIAAEEITGSADMRRAHDARARDFVEYGADAADRAAKSKQRELALSDLGVSTHPLAQLARAARPFVRQGYTLLVEPSANAAPAMHPLELPLAVAGQGLPAFHSLYRAVTPLENGNYMLALGQDRTLSVYQTADRGVHWQPVSIQDPRAIGIAGRCFGEDRHHAFTVGLDASHLRVTNLIDDNAVHSADLPENQTRVIAMACDDTAMVVALAQPRAERGAAPDSHEVGLFLCPQDSPCRALVPPSLAQGFPLQYPIDVARVSGTTVVALTRHGIVRSASSRDDGATWTPFIVAFDREAHPGLRVQVGVPEHLLALKNQIVLYAGSPKPGMTYPVLVSDDVGASWHTPGFLDRRVTSK